MRQLELDLKPAPSWGGRRTAAGRERGPNSRNAHRTRPPLASRFPCHVTLKARPGLPSLRSLRFVRELERSLRAANRAFSRRGAVLADRYHLHVLRTPREVRRAIAYVLLNARRHVAKRGLSLTAPLCMDPASSGR